MAAIAYQRATTIWQGQQRCGLWKEGPQRRVRVRGQEPKTNGPGSSSIRGRDRSEVLRKAAAKIVTDGPAVSQEEQKRARFSRRVEQPKVVICGGGFGGLYSALKLAEKEWPRKLLPEIILIDSQDRFLFKPLMYELLTEEAPIDVVAPEFSKLIDESKVNVVKAEVDCVTVASDGSGGFVTLDDQSTIDFDYVVLATGSKPRLELIPGSEVWAAPFYNLEDVDEVNAILDELVRIATPQRKSKLAVVGAGYAGVEVAASIQEKYAVFVDVSIWDPMFDVLPMAGESERNFVRSSLKKLGVEIHTSTSVKKMEAGERNQIRLCYENSDKEALTEEVDRVLLTAGQSVVCPKLRCKTTSEDSQCTPFPVTSRGKIESDEFSRARGFESFFVIGDVAEIRSDGQERPCPPTAQVAFQVSDNVVNNVYAAITGSDERKAFKYNHIGSMVSMGKINGFCKLTFLFNGIEFEGPIAGLVRKLVYAYRMPTLSQKIALGSHVVRQTAINWTSALFGRN